ncbi:uncharacterized protein LOC135395646 [Ornithodoros turicata]|uniref:uncharacterized protein LOC135395646 n=1 Tax=Ornithodoros turicata TaxID=34597 RepID=UPI003138B56C
MAMKAPYTSERHRVRGGRDGVQIVALVTVGHIATKAEQSYILIVTCAVTRAIHLELTKSMSAEDFMQAFIRFIARRGVPLKIYSDNFLTFKRVRRDLTLARLSQDFQVTGLLTSNRVTWRFIAERAAWRGSFWERFVAASRPPSARFWERAR